MGAPETNRTAGFTQPESGPNGPRSGPRARAPPSMVASSAWSRPGPIWPQPAAQPVPGGAVAAASDQRRRPRSSRGRLRPPPPPWAAAATSTAARCRLHLREVAPDAARRLPPRQATPTSAEPHRRQGENRPARISSRRVREGPPPPAPRGLCPAAHAGGGRGGRGEGERLRGG
jgi:hypothetical protein